jgi:hypothetical protein
MLSAETIPARRLNREFFMPWPAAEILIRQKIPVNRPSLPVKDLLTNPKIRMQADKTLHFTKRVCNIGRANIRENPESEYC